MSRRFTAILRIRAITISSKPICRELRKEDIKLNFQDGVLTIKAVHHQKATENQGYILNERCEGVYERSFSFEDADVDNINAAFVTAELDVSISKNKSSEAHAINPLNTAKFQGLKFRLLGLFHKFYLSAILTI